MPAKLQVRSATGGLHDFERGAFAIGDSIDNLTAAVDAVSAGVVLRVASELGEEIAEAGLAERGDDRIAGEIEFGAFDGFDSAAAALHFGQASLNKADAGDAAIGLEDFDGLSEPVEVDPFRLRVLVFEIERRHFGFAAAIKDVDLAGAEKAGRVSGVDGGVAGADDDDALAHGGALLGLICGDELEGVDE